MTEQESTKSGTGWRAMWRLVLDEGVARNPATLSVEAAARQPVRLEQKKDITARISETTRTLAFGSLASCYALLFANQELATVFAGAKPVLLWSAGFGIVSIIVDAAQYLFAYVNVQQALSADDQRYPLNWARRGRATSFVLKQLLAYLAALTLLIAVVITLFASPPPAPSKAAPPGPPATAPGPSRTG